MKKKWVFYVSMGCPMVVQQMTTWICATSVEDVKGHPPGPFHCNTQKRTKELLVCKFSGIALVGWFSSCYANPALRLFFRDLRCLASIEPHKSFTLAFADDHILVHLDRLYLRFDRFLIKSHPTVIYFLTMLVGAGGNAGGQSTVLVVRRLALAALRSKKSDREDPTGHVLSFRRIIIPEILVGAKLAVVLFGAAFLRCAIFKATFHRVPEATDLIEGVYGAECLAICLSMLVIVFTSTALGAALPLFLSHLGVDPAHAGATIQVLMDVSGVALTCVISSAVLGFQGTTVMGEKTLITPSADLNAQAESRHASGSVGAGVKP